MGQPALLSTPKGSTLQCDTMSVNQCLHVCRRLPDEDPSVREVRISCPDATGLGVDLTRVLLDFGLRILKGDVSTDGKWCFLIFKVGLNSNVPPRWNLLKTRCGPLRGLRGWGRVPGHICKARALHWETVSLSQ